MRRSLLFAALPVLAVLPLLTPRPAPAAPFTDAYTSLQGVLEDRRDHDFVPPLDRTRTKQRAAVLKSLKLLGKTAKDASADVKTGVVLFPLLERAYPDELGATPAGGDLRPAVGTALNGLRTDVEQRRSLANLTATALSESKARTQLQGWIDRAHESLDAAAVEPQASRSIKLIRTADRFVVKATKKISRLPGTMTVVVGSDAFQPNNVTATYDDATKRFVLTGTLSTKRPKVFRQLQIEATLGQGGPAFGHATWFDGTTATSGTLYSTDEAMIAVLSLDIPTRRAVGNFNFNAFAGIEDPPVDVVGESFAVRLDLQ